MSRNEFWINKRPQLSLPPLRAKSSTPKIKRSGLCAARVGWNCIPYLHHITGVNTFLKVHALCRSSRLTMVNWHTWRLISTPLPDFLHCWNSRGKQLLPEFQRAENFCRFPFWMRETILKRCFSGGSLLQWFLIWEREGGSHRSWVWSQDWHKWQLLLFLVGSIIISLRQLLKELYLISPRSCGP